MDQEFKDAFLPLLDLAAKVMAKRNYVVHSMWMNDDPSQPVENWELLNYRTRVTHPADPAALAEIEWQIMEVDAHLWIVLINQLNNRAPYEGASAPPGHCAGRGCLNLPGCPGAGQNR
jgi:hypothetical protein